MKPLDQITLAFKKNSPALMPYFTLGYPDYATSLDIIQACAEAGADLMELGVPFSDPLADGPTIQHSTQVALEKGMNVKRSLQAVRDLRARGVVIPFMLMGYVNPILAYGPKRFVKDAAEAGANGLIIPDLPPQEGQEIEALCREQGLALVYLLAPNSTRERIQLVSAHTTGFTYLVSVTGITGARTGLPPGLADFIGRVRQHSTLPLAVGFGISSPAQAAAVGQLADGIIVGSALIKAVEEALAHGNNPAQAAKEFIVGLRTSI